MRKFIISCFLICLFPLNPLMDSQSEAKNMICIKGAVKYATDVTLSDLRAMPSFFLKDVYLIEEKGAAGLDDKLISVAGYRGVLLRDLLLKAEMKYRRKWEPGVFIRVKNTSGREVVFSFGEIFYSSIGRSVLVAYEKDGTPLPFQNGCGELIVATDVRAGRRVVNVSEVIVERVDVKMLAYKDKKKKVARPPTSEFEIIDHLLSRSRKMVLSELKSLPESIIPAAVMAGDCEGFRGIYSFRGVPLKTILNAFGMKSPLVDYSRYVLVASEDGFCTTFSFGELFNSRLSANIIIAHEKDGEPLPADDGFAMSVVREDSMGGRSVKRIHRIELF